MKTKTAVRSVVLGSLFLLVPAHADFHFMKIVEVFAGTAAAPNAHYVVLQMYVSGQQFVANHALTVYDADGAQAASVAFPGNVANGDNQAKILIATAEAQAFFNVAPDLVMPAELMAAGGKVCFAGSVDCVAWGSWSGSSSGVGAPFNASGGLLPGQAAIRRLDIAGGATVLDAGDDTGNSANDFEFGPPEPRNNAGLFGSIPSSACGNDAIEGLEQCDDGNLADGDGCSATCQVDQAQQHPAEQDFDGDGQSDVFWRHAQSGRNAIWRSGNAGTRLATVGVSNSDWHVVGIGDFDGDGSADAFWRHQANGGNTIWLSADATTQQPTSRVLDQDWQVAAVGDFNGDGNADAFWRHQLKGWNAVWFSGNAGTSQARTSVGNTDWAIVGAGDFDRDGTDDLFWRNGVTGRNAIWLSANAATQQPTLGVSNVNWEVVGVGDFNGDGDDDVFWRERVTGRNAVWLSGNGSTQMVTTGVGTPSWKVVSAGDFNGDGESDVFWRNQETGSNIIWLSANSATRQPTLRVSDTDWQVVPYRGIAPVEPEPESGPVLTVADAEAFEGDGGTAQMHFTVSLSHPATSPVTYNIATSDGTATAGDDYTASQLSGEVIAAGEDSRTFSVTILGDIETEGDETLNVTVSSVSGGNATVADGRARGTIRDDDEYY